jgi:D-alanine transfer protein
MKKAPHVFPAVVSCLIVMALLAIGSEYAHRRENAYIHALAYAKVEQAYMGSALQRTALQYDDLLLLYGSSELTQGDPRYQAQVFFRKYPTGFMVFQIARPAANALTIAQSIAALGPGLRGKKVVISFTPSVFLLPMLNQEYYNSNFSRLHAYELVYSPLLSEAVKQKAAQRMLDYPASLEDDPLLQFALEHLARNSEFDRALFLLTWPLGQANLAIINLQDHAATVADIAPRLIDPDAFRKSRKVIDWDNALEKARKEQIPHSNNNPYGIDNVFWTEEYQKRLAAPIAPGSGDAEFLSGLEGSQEWTDLDILLQVLHEAGAEPLILSRPLNSPFLKALGISRKAQVVFYQKLRKAVQPYDFQLVDFRAYDQDKYFSIDRTSHPSFLGWMYVNQALDAFYHGRTVPNHLPQKP